MNKIISAHDVLKPDLDPDECKSVEIGLSYAQSAGAWKLVSDVQNAKGNVAAINSILSSKYGTFEEAFSRFKLSIHGIPLPIRLGLLRSIYLTSSAEGMGDGLVQDPVVPELHASILALGILGTGFEGSLSDIGMPFVRTHLGLFGGAGYEKRVDAFSSDLIESLPVHSGPFQLYGFEQSFNGHFRLDRSSKFTESLDLRETSFNSSVASMNADGDLENKFWTVRWKSKNQYDHLIAIPGSDRSSLGLQMMLGPQPIPEDILPITWDYAHHLESFGEFGTMIGVGGVLNLEFSGSNELGAEAGFYGGYPGGNLLYRFHSASATIGSWGLGGNSAYEALGQRIWIGSLGLAF